MIVSKRESAFLDTAKAIFSEVIKTVEALGLKKLHKTVVLPDNAATRGMIKQVQHLVKVEEA